jgi:opacity protein-like surface antigen
MSLSGEIGYFKANETYYPGQDKAIGWEIGLGLGYKVYNNLTYNAHFSYLATGDFFKQGAASAASTEDVYLLAHALSMTF